jgi:SMI1 / KNR4 family (SUKH-1)
MQFDTKRVAERLAYLKRHDPAEKVFGSNGHHYKLRRRAQESTVVTFEQRYGIELPQDFRRFLLELGNGGAGPYYGILGLDELYEANKDYWCDLTKPFPYSDAWKGDETLLKAIDDAIESDDDERYGRLLQQYDAETAHDGAISICEYGCNLRFLLIVNGDEYGNIWFDKTPDLVGYSPVAVDLDAPAEVYAHWCITDGSESKRPRTTFAEWYNCWLDWASRIVDRRR